MPPASPIDPLPDRIGRCLRSPERLGAGATALPHRIRDPGSAPCWAPSRPPPCSASTATPSPSRSTAAPGLPSFTVVGSPDSACREASGRVRAALLSSGCTWPQQRVTVNLAPPSVRKIGAGPRPRHRGGDPRRLRAGRRRPRSRGSRSSASSGSTARSGRSPARSASPRPSASGRSCCPAASADEARLVGDRTIHAVTTLTEVVACLRGRAAVARRARAARPPRRSLACPTWPTSAGSRSGASPWRWRRLGATTSSCSARPGAGKTMLASRLPGLLPPLTDRAALETTRIHSAAGLGLPPGGLVRQATVPGAPPRRVVGRAGRRRQRDDAPGRDQRRVQRRAVPRRAGRVRPARPRRAAPTAGGGRGAGGAGRRHRDLPGPVPARGGHEPLPVRLRRPTRRLPLHRRRPRPLPAPAVGAAPRPLRPARGGHPTVGERPDGHRPQRAHRRRARARAGGAGGRGRAGRRRPTPPSRSTGSTSSPRSTPTPPTCWPRRSRAAGSPPAACTGCGGSRARSPTCRTTPSDVVSAAHVAIALSLRVDAARQHARRPGAHGMTDARDLGLRDPPRRPSEGRARVASPSCSTDRGAEAGWTEVGGDPTADPRACPRGPRRRRASPRCCRRHPRYPDAAAIRSRAARPCCSPRATSTRSADVRVAIVGTRRCTGSGAGFARELGRELTDAGVAVVSGLALGIDGAAHRGVLEAGGRPVGVVGSGLDVVYPAKHRDLWGRVRDGRPAPQRGAARIAARRAGGSRPATGSSRRCRTSSSWSSRTPPADRCSR